MPPAHFQGRAFAGAHAQEPREFNFGFRGRMDERYDMVRSARDKRYVYIRNYMPHKLYGQHVSYMFETPTTQVWKAMFDAGKLNEAQPHFWRTKPAEELYDLESDPDEVRNLAASQDHQEILQRLRKAQRDWELEIRDVGFLPEGEIHGRAAGSTPYEVGHDGQQYPLVQIMTAAELASDFENPKAVDELKSALAAEDSAIRYWGAMGLLMRGAGGIAAGGDLLRKALADASPNVRIVAAEALAKHGTAADLEKSLPVLLEAASLEKNGVYVSMLALNALDELDGKAAGVAEQIAALPKQAAGLDGRLTSYVPRLLEKTLADLK
jgi:uncharacterized sulfatase